jgi:hypothetical protein
MKPRSGTITADTEISAEQTCKRRILQSPVAQISTKITQRFVRQSIRGGFGPRFVTGHDFQSRHIDSLGLPQSFSFP